MWLYVPVCPSVYMSVCVCLLPSLLPPPHVSSPACVFGVCSGLSGWDPGAAGPFQSAEQSLGWGERGGLQLLPPLPKPRSPRGESSAGLLPSGCMNISSAGAWVWLSTSVLAPPAPFAWPARPPKAERVVDRSRAGRGPWRGTCLAWGAMAECVEGLWGRPGKGQGGHILRGKPIP